MDNTQNTPLKFNSEIEAQIAFIEQATAGIINHTSDLNQLQPSEPFLNLNIFPKCCPINISKSEKGEGFYDLHFLDQECATVLTFEKVPDPNDPLQYKFIRVSKETVFFKKSLISCNFNPMISAVDLVRKKRIFVESDEVQSYLTPESAVPFNDVVFLDLKTGEVDRFQIDKAKKFNIPCYKWQNFEFLTTDNLSYKDYLYYSQIHTKKYRNILDKLIFISQLSLRTRRSRIVHVMS